MRFRYRRRVTPDDVGARVSLRRWIDDPARGRVPSDVVGRLVAWSGDGTLTVERRDGTAVEIPHDDVLASRVVPDRRAPPPGQARPPDRGDP